jgi:RNA polymerase sigma-70 factor (ECF subfamily)
MAMHAPISDEQINTVVKACQRGETAAIERLYDLYADRLYRYLLARVGDPDDAADLTTDLFLSVIEHIQGFRLNPDHPAATFSAWLYRIAANLAAGYHRSRRKRDWVNLDDHLDHPAADPTPGHLVVEREEVERLAQAMNELSEEQRLVITGRFIETMSNAEVAAWMGKTEGAIKALQHRALQTLARLLGGESKKQRRPWISLAER